MNKEFIFQGIINMQQQKLPQKSRSRSNNRSKASSISKNISSTHSNSKSIKELTADDDFSIEQSNRRFNENRAEIKQLREKTNKILKRLLQKERLRQQKEKNQTSIAQKVTGFICNLFKAKPPKKEEQHNQKSEEQLQKEAISADKQIQQPDAPSHNDKSRLQTVQSAKRKRN